MNKQQSSLNNQKSTMNTQDAKSKLDRFYLIREIDCGLKWRNRLYDAYEEEELVIAIMGTEMGAAMERERDECSSEKSAMTRAIDERRREREMSVTDLIWGRKEWAYPSVLIRNVF